MGDIQRCGDWRPGRLNSYADGEIVILNETLHSSVLSEQGLFDVWHWSPWLHTIQVSVAGNNLLHYDFLSASWSQSQELRFRLGKRHLLSEPQSWTLTGQALGWMGPVWNPKTGPQTTLVIAHSLTHQPHQSMNPDLCVIHGTLSKYGISWMRPHYIFHSYNKRFGMLGLP